MSQTCKFCNRMNGCNCSHYIINTVNSGGRFCNSLIRNLAASFIVEKTDQYIDYANYDKINNQLGVPLYVGSKLYPECIILSEDNYWNVLNNAKNININPNHHYFQTKEITNMFYQYFRREPIKSNIIEKNPYRSRYNNNNNCFVHVRLGDILTNGLFIDENYYLKALKEIDSFDHLYIASDSPDHEIVKKIIDAYSDKCSLVLKDEVETIQFGSTCKQVLLSHGSFSAVIGWLSFFSNVYFPEYITGRVWFGDMFCIEGWNKITNYM
jgi:hypothetical protein